MSIFTPRVGGKRELSLANDLLKQNKYNEALEKAKEGLTIIRKSGSVKEIAFANAKVLEIQGIMHEDKSNHQNATGAFGQAGRYYKQAEAKNDETRVLKKQAMLLQEIGRKKAENKAFESAASAFEEAAISLKKVDHQIEALEVRAKAFVFRAASVRNAADRKTFLLKAVDLFKKSGIDKPIILGHLEYYSAMAQRLSDKNQAIETLTRAIEHYQNARNQSMVNQAKSMQSNLIKSLQEE